MPRKSIDNLANSSLSFDGTNTNRVNTSTSVPTLNLLNNFTVVCLIKASKPSVGGRIVSKNFYNGTGGWGLGYSSTGYIMLTTYGVKDYISTVYKLPVNKYVFLAAKFDSSNGVTFYADGVQVDYITGTNPAGAEPNGTLTIGARINSAATVTEWIAPSKIKYILVFNTALTAAQISDLYYSNIVPRENLVGEWLMNRDTNATCYDTSGNGNHGTITGAVHSSDTPTKARKLIGGNLVENGDFENYSLASPQVATTVNGKFIDGTAEGSTTNIYGVKMGKGGTGFAVFEEKNNRRTLHIGATTVGSFVEAPVESGISSKSLKIKSLTQYICTFNMETAYISGDSSHGCNLALLQLDITGVSILQTSSNSFIKTTTGRTKYSIAFTTPAGAYFITPRMTYYGHTGAATLIMDAWFDDITLTEV